MYTSTYGHFRQTHYDCMNFICGQSLCERLFQLWSSWCIDRILFFWATQKPRLQFPLPLFLRAGVKARDGTHLTTTRNWSRWESHSFLYFQVGQGGLSKHNNDVFKPIHGERMGQKGDEREIYTVQYMGQKGMKGRYIIYIYSMIYGTEKEWKGDIYSIIYGTEREWKGDKYIYI